MFFAGFERDILSILPQRFIAFERPRACLSNTSTKVIYDEAIAQVELSLLALKAQNMDLSSGDMIIFNKKHYQIYQIQMESRVMIRIFLKECPCL
ncbi:hypothetical protein LS71_002690 [Helicobacter jaachi]|uniref:Uncharacterized protein n=1 Tax=Helicobacter jaachi TaxID=1677920 RepID=A0A4U8TCJ3_9HELI|nr:hypothetical protein [Helicobacter jaachi]TLD97665.1 hypothetical protein LS71_002690 [Helicobacter jaachi]